MMPDTSATDLVRRAFQLAKDSGKDTWQRMAIPVLKNRILLLTGGQFKESEFDATSFRDFLNRLPEGVVTVDESQPPGFVNLCSDDKPSTSPGVDPQHARVRSDLWRAALDYSSGQRYVWDAQLNQARVARAGEVGPFMPTISADDFRALRASFADAHKNGPEGGLTERLMRWASEGLPTMFLPARLRPLWNIELKRQVETRLRPWLQQNNFEAPPDFTYAWQAGAAPRSGVDQLRQFVINCVKVMSEQELASLPIPARAAMRVRLDDRS